MGHAGERLHLTCSAQGSLGPPGALQMPFAGAHNLLLLPKASERRRGGRAFVPSREAESWSGRERGPLPSRCAVPSRARRSTCRHSPCHQHSGAGEGVYLRAVRIRAHSADSDLAVPTTAGPPLRLVICTDMERPITRRKGMRFLVCPVRSTGGASGRHGSAWAQSGFDAPRSASPHPWEGDGQAVADGCVCWETFADDWLAGQLDAWVGVWYGWTAECVGRGKGVWSRDRWSRGWLDSCADG